MPARGHDALFARRLSLGLTALLRRSLPAARRQESRQTQCACEETSCAVTLDFCLLVQLVTSNLVRRSTLNNLHVEPFRILDVKTRVHVLFGARPVQLQFARDRFLIEVLHANREVVDEARRTLVVKRNQRLGDPEAHDFVVFVLAHHSKTEKLLVEINGTLQVVDLNADVIDFYAFETGVLKSGDSRSARSRKHRQALD